MSHNAVQELSGIMRNDLIYLFGGLDFYDNLSGNGATYPTSPLMPSNRVCKKNRTEYFYPYLATVSEKI